MVLCQIFCAMKVLVVAVSLIAAIAARPDVSHLPTGSYLPVGGTSESGHIGSASGISSGGISGFGGGVSEFGFESHGEFGSSGASGGFGGISGISGPGGYGLDHKHVYFFSAPEDEAAARLRINVIPNSQRNTKIIFVKAPSYGGVVPEVVAPQSVLEDKTLVYVLVKRPEHGGQITIPAGVGVKPSKPEVFFIKYKTQLDAQQQIVSGLQGQPIGSHVPDLGNESNFVRTLEAAGSHGVGAVVGGPSSGASFSSQTSESLGTSSVTSGTSGSNFGPAGASGPY